MEPVGAGDAFAAGFLAGVLRGAAPAQALRPGHITAVPALQVAHDHSPLPGAQRIGRLLALPATEC
jgi:2-dehydro-3-deoxygluconokinase